MLQCSSFSTGSLVNFLMSSSNKAYNPLSGISSQFFPGKTSYPENVTPDSGVEDVTPDYNQKYRVHPLKTLAAAAAKQSVMVNTQNRHCDITHFILSISVDYI